MIADNLAAVRLRMAAAASRAGRDPDEVRLVVVSKTQPVEQIALAKAAGVRLFGENRVQEALEKIDALAGQGLHWHFIGHLQKNKVKYIIGRFELIHSVDSVDLAERISALGLKRREPTSILIQVNVSGEAAKSGVRPDDLEETLKAAAGLAGVRVEGLMTIPPYDPDPEASRPIFSRLRELAKEFDGVGGGSLKELSMGMSGDFEVAIEEGATLVRVGTAIFGERPGPG